MKRYHVISFILFSLLLLISGCTPTTSKVEVSKKQIPKKLHKKRDIKKKYLSSFEQKHILENTEDDSIFLKENFITHSAKITDMLTTKDGKVITASLDKSINVYDIKTKKILQKILGQITSLNGGIEHIAISSDGKFLAVSGDLPLETIDLDKNFKRSIYLLKHEQSTPVRIYDLQTARLLKVLHKHMGSITDLAFSNDNKYLLCSSTDGKLLAWRTENFLKKKSYPFNIFLDKDYISKMKISKKNQLFILDDKHTTISLYNKIKSFRDISEYINILDLKMYREKMLDFDLNQKDIAILMSNSKIMIYKNDLKKKHLKQKLTIPFDAKLLTYTKDGRYLGVNGKNNFIIFDAQNSYKQVDILKIKQLDTIVAITSTKKSFIIASNKQELFTYTFSNKKFDKMISTHKSVQNIDIFKNILMIDFDKEKKYLNLKNFKFIPKVSNSYISKKIDSSKKTPFKLILEEKHKLIVLKDGYIVTKIIAKDKINKFYLYKNYIVVGDEIGLITVYDTYGHTIAKLSAHQSALKKFIFKNDKLISLDEVGIIYIWNLKLLDFAKRYLIGINEYSLSQKIKPRICDAEWYNGTLDALHMIKADIRYQSKAYDQSRRPNKKSLSSSDKIIPSFGLLVTQKDYIIWNAENYFMSSENGANNMAYYLNNNYYKETKLIPINTLYDHFFRPDFIKLNLQGIDITPFTKGLTYQDVLKTPPPSVTIDAVSKKDINKRKRVVKLNFNVTQNDNGGIGIIRIYQEGKLIKTLGDGKINRTVADIESKLKEDRLNQLSQQKQKEYLASLKKVASKSVQNINMADMIGDVEIDKLNNKEGKYNIVIPVKAGKNTISIEAFNKTNTVASLRRSITFNANVKKYTPKIYAIVAGVNKFEQANVSDLKYSQNDAKSIAQEIKKATKYKTDITLLLGKDVTKDKIFKTIKNIKKKMNLEDKIIFYISTHGKAARGRLYLVPQNNKSVKNWINFSELFKKIQSLNALEQIFVIDACESGSASEIMSSIYDAKASVLAKQSGVHLLMATTKGTFAFESTNKNIHHGVFTNNILKALNSKNTDKNKDNIISVVELSKTLQEPSYSVEHQYPVIRNMGEDTKLKNLRR